MINITIKLVPVCYFLASLLLSFDLAADMLANKTFSFFTTHQQRLLIEERIGLNKPWLSDKNSGLGYIQSKHGIRLLLPNKSIRQVKKLSINPFLVDKKSASIEVIKSIQ